MGLAFLTRLAGLKRPIKPKVVVFTNQQVSALKNDYTDEIATSEMLRGKGSTYGYAIPRDAINSDLRLEGSPLIRMTGDEFCSAAESFIWLGADKTLLVGGGPLTENNGPTYVSETSDDESPLYEQTIGNLVSSSSQYWSLPTAAAVQVGTNSFEVSIAFKTTATGLQYMVFYGDLQATKQNWEIYFDSNGKLSAVINDGTNNPQIQDSIANRWQDGREHIVTLLVDRTTNLMYLICDGVNLSTPVSISAVTGTLTLAGTSILIGASNNNGTKANFFNGNLSLCKIINNAADYNVPQVWNMGIREAVSTAGTTLPPTNDSTQRLNNNFKWSSVQNDYSYATIVVEDGEYEIQESYLKNTNAGISQLLLDSNVISTVDRYNGSLTVNNIVKTFGIKLSGGRHLVKYFTNSKNASSSGYICNNDWINFIKRRGHEQGGVDDFLFLGDEINERANTTWTFNNSNSAYYANIFGESSPANGNYTEGSIFVKGGLYRIDIFYATSTDVGKHDLWFGNAQVLNQLDGYSGSLVYNNIQTIYIRLQQGRQDIRLALNGKNASSSNYNTGIESIRGMRLSD